jgi:hypothetical protein
VVKKSASSYSCIVDGLEGLPQKSDLAHRQTVNEAGNRAAALVVSDLLAQL